MYTSRALTNAKFKEMNSDEFKEKETHLAPLDNALRESNIRSRLLAEDYRYPLEDAMHVEQDIQRYFDGKIADPLDDLFQDLGNMDNCFGNPSIIRQP